MGHSLRSVGSDDDSGFSTDLPDVFSDDAPDESSGSAFEPDSDDGDAEDYSDNDSILDDKEDRELPAAHYLQEAECLDVSQPQQRRYSPRTRPSWTRRGITGTESLPLQVLPRRQVRSQAIETICVKN
ncbi:hypothetical protein BDV10DRAFT_185959 [Aspergillus recurvatus]